MNKQDILQCVVQQFHTVVLATADQNKPMTCVMDMMDHDQDNLYFLTAVGKRLYDRLLRNPYVSLSVFKGQDTLSSYAISIQGIAQETQYKTISELFEKNPYMWSIYPTKESQSVLRVFRLKCLWGEWFDLRTKPVTRFSFGSPGEIYRISEVCTLCGKCQAVCPQSCIVQETTKYKIEQNHCLHCGKCMEVCPVHAVERS